jgi:hypothetical protein
MKVKLCSFWHQTLQSNCWLGDCRHQILLTNLATSNHIPTSLKLSMFVHGIQSPKFLVMPSTSFYEDKNY